MNAPRPVVPASMARPKRIAKQLHQIYPATTLSECQATTAHLFFHKDWHALEQAVDGQKGSAPFDEDLDTDTLAIRVKAQCRLLFAELGKMDPDHSYAPPKDPHSEPITTHDELAKYFMASYMQVPERELMSAGRYHRLLAMEAHEEICPTSRKAPPPHQYEDIMSLVDTKSIEQLPGQIAQWWSVNVPHQSVVAEQWAQLDFNANSRISVLNAGQYWGVLCLYYANSIAWDMCMGVAYLFALRYAMLRAQDEPSFDELASIAFSKTIADTDQKVAFKALNKLWFEATEDFFNAFARDDFLEIFYGDPNSFLTNAKECLEIFGDPKSRRGSWNL